MNPFLSFKAIFFYVLLIAGFVHQSKKFYPPPQLAAPSPLEATFAKLQLASLHLEAMVMPVMLIDALITLKQEGFWLSAAAVVYEAHLLIHSDNLTVFVVSDQSILFGGSLQYLYSRRLHFVPNYYLSLHHLQNLPTGSTIPTLEGIDLVVTGQGTHISINNVRITPPLRSNPCIIIYQIDAPFSAAVPPPPPSHTGIITPYLGS